MPAQSIREEYFSSTNHLLDIQGMSGNCISIYLPLDGSKEGSNVFSTRMKAMLKRARQRILDEFGDEAASEWPPADLSGFADKLRHGPQQGGLAIFCCDGKTRVFYAPRTWDEELHVGAECYVRPLLLLLMGSEAFYLLALSEQKIRLLLCTREGGKSVSLPDDLPENLTNATLFEPPDHRLEHGSASGPMPGQERGIRFGTSADEEKHDLYLKQFFSQVDASLRALLTRHNYPLMLAGVKRQLALYSSISTYEHLLAHHVEGSPRWLSTDDLYQLSGEAWDAYRVSLEEEILQELGKADSQAKMVTDAIELLPAVESGKIHHLVLPERESGDARDEMLNHLALAALRQRTRISVLRHYSVPGGYAAGILRYGRGERSTRAMAS